MKTHYDPFEEERKRVQSAATERLNELGMPPTESSDVRSIARSALKGQGELLRNAATRTDHTAPESRLADPNDPYSLLKLNQQFSKETFVLPEPRKSTRVRDYLLVMIPGNGLFLGLVAFAPKTPFIIVPALGGVILVSTSVTWIFWVVMDREQFCSSVDKKKKP